MDTDYLRDAKSRFINPGIRSIEPYRQLVSGSATATDSILLSPPSSPFTGIFHSLRHGHFFNAHISLVAILCEALIVALATIAFKPGTAFVAYTASTFITTAILAMMLVGVVCLPCTHKSRLPNGGAREPETLVGVMLLLFASHMLESLAGLAMMKRNERDELLKSWGKKYARGSVVGIDEQEREGIVRNEVGKLNWSIVPSSELI